MSCESCKGGCGGCSGCGGHAPLELAPGEIEMLLTLSQIPFLPVARSREEDTPIFLEDNAHSPAEYSLILRCLEKRGLISIDFDKPLSGFRSDAYQAYPIHGSFALTHKGQQVVEFMDLNGIEES